MCHLSKIKIKQKDKNYLWFKFEQDRWKISGVIQNISWVVTSGTPCTIPCPILMSCTCISFNSLKRAKHSEKKTNQKSESVEKLQPAKEKHFDRMLHKSKSYF